MFHRKFVIPTEDFTTIQYELVNEIGLVGAYLLSYIQESFSDRVFMTPDEEYIQEGIHMPYIMKLLKISKTEFLNGCKKLDDLGVGWFDWVNIFDDMIYFQPESNLFTYTDNIKRVMKPVKIFNCLLKHYGLKYAYFYGLLCNVAEIQYTLHTPIFIGEKPFVELTDKAKGYFKDFNLMKMLDFFRKKGLVDYVTVSHLKKLYFHLNFSNLRKLMVRKRQLNKLDENFLEEVFND